MKESIILALVCVTSVSFAQEVYKGTPIDDKVMGLELEDMKEAIDAFDDGPYDLVYVLDADGQITCSDESGRKTMSIATPTANPIVWENGLDGEFVASSYGT